MGTQGKVAVEIPDDLHHKIEERLKGSAFSSVDDFVAFVLARLSEGPAKSGEPLSVQDEARVRDRLRSLGYID